MRVRRLGGHSRVTAGGPTKDAQRALIVAAGGLPDRELIGALTTDAVRVVAADGGAVVAESCGLTVDVVIGDLDSLPPAWSAAHPATQVVHVADQEDTDLAKALSWCAEEALLAVDVVGIDGGRPDHALGVHLALAAAPTALELVLHLRDADVLRMLAGSPELVLKLPPGTHVSLIALGTVHEVRLTGTRWPLDQETLTTDTRGLHNLVLEPPLRLTRGAGAPLLLMCVHPVRGAT